MKIFVDKLTGKLFAFMLMAILANISYSQEPRLRPEKWAKPVLSKNLSNWYKLDDKVYRSAQPEPKGFEDAIKMEIKNVLNLRDNHSDNDEAKDLSLNLHRVKMDAGDIKKEQIVEALKIIKNSEGRILVHCWHGSDRTGAVCAMYRIVFQNWSKEDAIDELKNGGYGYHTLYKNILSFINDADIDEIKKSVYSEDAKKDEPAGKISDKNEDKSKEKTKAESGDGKPSEKK